MAEGLERWEPVEDFEPFYAISDHGLVLGYERWIHRIHTRPYLQKSGLLAPRIGNKHGHLCVTLYDEQGMRHKKWIHRLVAVAFLPNPLGLPYVLHGIRGPACNHYSNLRWGNHSENEKDKLRHKVARQESRNR
jgi:hypothetical protein